MITRNNLQIGKYYVGTFSDYEIIVKMEFKSLYSKNPFIGGYGDFNIGECLTGDGISFREANEIEKYWIDLCIERGGTVSKPTSIPNDNYEIY